MARLARNIAVAPGEAYHVIARGNGGVTIFEEHEDYEAYLEFTREAQEKHGVAIFHYALMPNHMHFLVSPSSELSGFMHAVQLRYAKRFCKRHKFAGHVWQGRYKSLRIDSDPYLFACGNYIEMNPVRAGLVERPEDWPHSSYRAYAYGEKDKIVTIDPFYITLGRNTEERMRMYRDSVASTRA